MQKVWHRAVNGWWYATSRENGSRQQIKLVQAPDNKDGKKLAEAELVRELAEREPDPDEPKVQGWITVAHVVSAFLKHSREEHAPETADWYRNLLTPFVAMWGKLKYRRLKKRHVRKWLKEKGYNPTSQNRACGALKRAFAWAVEEEHIPRSPVAHLKKPTALVRDRILTLDERALILGSIQKPSFREFVLGMTLTGCRPGEVARVSRENVNLEAGLWIFAKHKTAKQTGKPRVVYLCPEALELTRKLLAQHPEGPLFRNARGKPWTRNAVRIRFKRLRDKHPELKGVIAYTYRSSFATDALEAGIPDATVAQLLGHTNTDTLHKFYARLSQKVEHMKDAAAKATRPAEGGDPRGIAG